MSDRFKPYLIIIVSLLLAGIFLNVPVAFATKLPAACNVFNPPQVNKAGPCGQQGLLSNENAFDGGPYSLLTLDLEICSSAGNPNHSSSLPGISPVNFYSLPIRC